MGQGQTDGNARKHGVTFESASTVFFDPNLLTVADLEHSTTEDRCLFAGIAGNGVWMSIVYLWSDADSSAIKVRLISARLIGLWVAGGVGETSARAVAR